MAGGLRSPLAPWLGGASAPSGLKGGYRSMLAFWMGGVSNGEVTPTPDVEPLGGGPGRPHYVYHAPYSELREREFEDRLAQERRAELRRVEEELAEVERLRQESLAASERKRKSKKAAKELAALEARLQEEINRLRMERVWLIRLIDDEEAILALLLSMPFH